MESLPRTSLGGCFRSYCTYCLVSLVRIHICLVLNPGWSCFTNIPPKSYTSHWDPEMKGTSSLHQLGPDSCPFVGPVFETWVQPALIIHGKLGTTQRRFRDANWLEGNVFSQKWSVSVCLVLCDPGDTGDTGTFRVYSQAQLRTSHRHQRWQTCLFGDFQFIHVAFLSHVPAGWNDFFFWLFPPWLSHSRWFGTLSVHAGAPMKSLLPYLLWRRRPRVLLNYLNCFMLFS